jgi:hypothetical protein
MSYKAAARMRPIFAILHLTADDTLASGDPVGWAVQDGTSGHGVTVTSGVIALPNGYHWFVQSQVTATTLTTVDLDWYVDSAASTTFQETGVSLIGSGTSGSNCVAHCYIDAASASVDLELRASGAITADADFCFVLLIGYPT